METNTAPTKKQINDASFAFVYTDPDKLVQDAAKEACIANLGHTLDDFFVASAWALLGAQSGRHIAHCWSNFYGQHESDEQASMTDEERLAWVKQAKKDVVKVQKKKLPLTLENMRLAFFNQGPFEKKR